MAVKIRCVRCRKYVRSDGTCQNEDCVLYVPEITVDDDDVQSTSNNEVSK